jgi:hypothetical protein
MDELLARSESERLISAAALDLEGQAAAKRMNHFVAKLLGAIANALDYREIADRVQSLLMALTAEDFFKASITNIDLHRLSANELDRLRQIEPLESFNRTHPVYVRNQAVPDVQRFASALDHLKPCLNGDVATAVAIANSELEFEDIADTLAALGKYEEAIALVDCHVASEDRRRSVRHVVLLEKCRRFAPDFLEEIGRSDLKDFDRLTVILALAGRRPWVGYPFSDY